MGHREEQQERARREEELIRWKRATGRLGETWDNAGERDRLVRVVAMVRGEILQREGGDLAKVVWRRGGKLLAPHIDAERVTRFLGEQHNVDQFELLEQMARLGVPVDVGPGGNLARELAYGNHRSADKHASEVWRKQ